MAVRKAASVFPDPVGAEMSVWRPRRIASHPSRCARVGAQNVSVNHLATTGANPETDMSSPVYGVMILALRFSSNPVSQMRITVLFVTCALFAAVVAEAGQTPQRSAVAAGAATD